ncbi:hypothetical protein M0802_016017 [Mischocyttarus mexicanus]|nr:hypothetical protein M0802_016017 [Mischocyttarus mexicanus]
MVAETKYLGVFIGTRFNMSTHITYVSNKSKVIFSQLASVAKSNWGFSTKTMKAIYKGVFVPIISYAAAGWADKINVYHKRRLTQAQRYALIRVTKAYRTISTDAVCIIAGVTPIDLLLVEIRNTYFLRRNITFQHFDVSFAAQEQICKIEIKNRKCTIRKTTTKIWQEQWNVSEKGRITFEYFDNIQERLNANWIHHNHYMVQILSGHGNFNYQLKRLGLAQTDKCKCEETDTVKHVIFDCALLKELRKEIEDAVKSKTKNWPCELKQLRYLVEYGNCCKGVSWELKSAPIQQGKSLPEL